MIVDSENTPNNTLNLNIDKSDYPILDSQYSLLKKVGKGATCKVYLSKPLDTDTTLAIKVLNKTSRLETTNKYYIQEVEMLKKIDNPNIIKMHNAGKGIIKKPDGRTKMVDYIALEYASNGELFDYIYFPRKPLTETIARNIFTQLINGLEGCHKAGVSHRDLKTENIMLDHSYKLKIADFGYSALSAGKSGNGMLNTFLGTISYASPEILSKKPYNGTCADIFSIGVVLYVLTTAKLPFGKAMVFDAYYKHIVRNDYETFWKLSKANISDSLKSLINLLIAYDSAQRPSIEEIKNHPWMKNDIADDETVMKDFNLRKAVVLQGKEVEAADEKKKKARKGGVYRGDSDEDLNADLDLFQGERDIEEFDFKVNGIVMGNPYSLNMKGGDYNNHLNYLVRYFRGKYEGVEVIPNKNNAKFKLVFNPEIDMAEGNGNNMNENDIGNGASTSNKEMIENYMAMMKDMEKLEVQVELRRCVDNDGDIDDNDNDIEADEEEKFKAEFTRVKGDKLEFFNVYDELIEFTQKE